MRNPNNEQRTAIEHAGGVLLSAGAGSGKTFVLIEHIIYLINKFVGEYDFLSPQSNNKFKDDLQTYLSSIVMMTFTKKATYEIGLRLHERIEKQIEVADKPEIWSSIST